MVELSPQDDQHSPAAAEWWCTDPPQTWTIEAFFACFLKTCFQPDRLVTVLRSKVEGGVQAAGFQVKDTLKVFFGLF